MIEEIARVVAIDDGYAFVEVTRTSSCNTCNAKQACGTASLTGMFRFQPPALKLKNDIAANPGDEVIVALPEQTMLTGSFMLYIIPLIMLVLFAIGFDFVLGLFFFIETELIQVAGGLTGLVAGLFIVRKYSARFLNDTSMASLVKVTHNQDFNVAVNKIG
ncbi:MAG: SoxR reducing system RseC family protein [Gammaproteobacteria bacterium]|nr:SoxR reducing system RseC family protein [Gammaproteobacteria bacterium]